MARDLVQFIESVRPEILQQEIIVFCQTLPEHLYKVKRIQLTRSGTLAMIHYRMLKSPEEMTKIAKQELDQERERLMKEKQRVIPDSELQELAQENSKNTKWQSDINLMKVNEHPDEKPADYFSTGEQKDSEC